MSIYLIDNSYKSYHVFFKNVENVEYIFNNKNLGYGKGHNIAIKKAIELNSRYHLIVNPDVRFNKDSLSKLINFMDRNNDIGMCIPKVLYSSGKLQYLCKLIPSPKELFIRRFVPFKKIVERNNRSYELKKFDYNESIEIPYISGCFMFARTAVLKEVNGFDERFFLYFEDLDLTRRIREISKTVFYSKTFIYHNYNKESYRNNKVFMYHLISTIKYFNKWGWFFDKNRKEVNKETLSQLNNRKWIH